MPYRGVIFDLYGTLIDGWDVEEARLRTTELAHTLGAPVEAFQELMETSYTERATAALGPLPEMLIDLCRRVGHTPTADAVTAATKLRMEQFREVLSKPRAETPSLLATLRDRALRVAVISDSSSETPELWPSLNWTGPIMVALFSWTERRRKPDGQLYRKALATIELSAPECIYVGDGGSHELSGAEAMGIRAFRIVHHPGQPDSHLQYDPDTKWSGQEISTLSEVLPLLG